MRDDRGRPVPRFRISFEPRDSGARAVWPWPGRWQDNEAGRWHTRGHPIAAGTYRVVCEAPGYAATRSNAYLRAMDPEPDDLATITVDLNTAP